MYRTIKDVKFHFEEVIYLASPYSHPDPEVERRRAVDVCVSFAQLQAIGFSVFCPIAHSMPAVRNARMLKMRQATHEQWMNLDIQILGICKKLIVLTLDGWMSSKGIHQEMDFARSEGIPVYHFSPKDILDSAKKYGCI